MISDSERREVAARLRKLEMGVTGTAVTTHTLAKNILDAIKYGHSGAMTPYGLLADLIEPSIPSDPGEAGLASADGFIREMRHSTKEEQNAYNAMLEKMSVEMHPVDRDALLALADEMEEETGSVCGVCMGKTASRIRKALGVER